ncbi:hypothetical protein [Wenyingzhuangia fucanilytica]|nr:hypothetical protein [Wenyingzhuangia fucanilytica]
MKRIILLLFSITFLNCSQKEEVYNHNIAVDTFNKTLYSGEEFIIKAISDLPLTYTSENNYHASVLSVDKWDNANIKAGFVGKTVIKITNGEDTKEVNLIVSPLRNLFPTPPLELFGTSKQEVISAIGVPDEETDTSIKYYNYSDAAPYISYFFNDENALYSINIAYKIGRSYALDNFLSERYRFAGVFINEVVGNGFVYYNSLRNITPTIAIYLYGLDRNHDAVVYQPYIEQDDEETSSKTSLLIP